MLTTTELCQHQDADHPDSANDDHFRDACQRQHKS